MLDAFVRPHLPATKKHKGIQSTDPGKLQKQIRSISSHFQPSSIQACPALRAPEAPRAQHPRAALRKKRPHEQTQTARKHKPKKTILRLLGTQTKSDALTKTSGQRQGWPGPPAKYLGNYKNNLKQHRDVTDYPASNQ
jgi:hypothetical protein